MTNDFGQWLLSNFTTSDVKAILVHSVLLYRMWKILLIQVECKHSDKSKLCSAYGCKEQLPPCLSYEPFCSNWLSWMEVRLQRRQLHHSRINVIFQNQNIGLYDTMTSLKPKWESNAAGCGHFGQFNFPLLKCLCFRTMKFKTTYMICTSKECKNCVEIDSTT